VRSLAAQESIGAMMVAMKARKDSIGLACEAFNKMFSKGEEDLVGQALRHDLIPYLLKLLEGLCHPGLYNRPID